jgi:hypothetical protein
MAGVSIASNFIPGEGLAKLGGKLAIEEGIVAYKMLKEPVKAAAKAVAETARKAVEKVGGFFKGLFGGGGKKVVEKTKMLDRPTAGDNIGSRLRIQGTGEAKIPGKGYHNETYAQRPVKPQDATDKWDEFLGPGEHTNIHPRTGEPDPNRIVSSDGKRSIRYGDHEMNSNPTKHHYHEETWTYDPVNDVMNVDNSVVRVPNPKR